MADIKQLIGNGLHGIDNALFGMIQRLDPNAQSIVHGQGEKPYLSPLAQQKPQQAVLGAKTEPKVYNLDNPEDKYINSIRNKYPDIGMSDDQLRKIYQKYAPTPTPTTQPKEPLSIQTATQQPSSSTNIDPHFEGYLNKYVFPITDKAGIPRSLAAAQTALESGRATSQAAINNNNLHGLMTWDAQGNRSLAKFDSPEQSTQEYVNTIKDNFPQAYALRDDPAKMLEAMQNGKMRYEGDNPNPMEYVSKIQSMPEWSKYLPGSGGN